MRYPQIKRDIVFDGLLAAAAGVVALFAVGCSSPRGELFPPLDRPLVWPEAPDAARIKYVGSLSTETDLKMEISLMEGLGELIFGKKKTGILLGPYAVAVDTNDRLFVTDGPAAVVHVFDLNTREYRQFADLAENEKLLGPVGLTIADGRIYVVDSILAKVCVFDRDGEFMFSFGQERLQRPSGIAYSRPGRKIYVTDTARHVVNVFGKDGEFAGEIGRRGFEPGTFNFPTHLWVDDVGQLYVSDTLNYRIQVFSSDGEFLRTFGEQGDRPGNFAHPCGIAVDSHGHIYVIDRQFENIQVFDNYGHILMAFGEEGSRFGQFWLPAGMWIDRENRILIADSFNKRVQIFQLLEESEQ